MERVTAVRAETLRSNETQRVEVYDVLRGVAILGILLANITAFASSFEAELTFDPINAGPTEHWIEVLRNIFVTGKFRSMLAVLFGVGIFLQFKQRSMIPGNWPGGYMKRTAYLALFGLVHGFLIWYGDILFVYSGVAFVACLVADKPDATIAKATKWLSILAAFVGLMAFAVFQVLSTMDFGSKSISELLGLGNELAIYQSGSFLEQLLFRCQIFGMNLTSVFLFGPLIMPLFLAGILFERSSFFAAPSQHPELRRKLLLVGFGLGIPLNAVALLSFVGVDMFALSMFIEVLGGPVLAIGYMALLASIYERFNSKSLFRTLGNVGRMAFSNYILQSIVCTTIFYSYGLGWFGKLDFVQQLGVVAIVWLINLVFSAFWLRWFRLGPIEWLWRSLTESRRLAIRKP